MAARHSRGEAQPLGCSQPLPWVPELAAADAADAADAAAHRRPCRWRRIREQIAATAPDVIALQELDRAYPYP